MKHFAIIILYNFIHIFLFFLIPFNIIQKIIDPNGFLDYSFFIFLISIYSVAQVSVYILIMKKLFPKTFTHILKEIQDVP